MTKRFIKNEKTGRLVDADGVVGKKIIKDLKEKGKTIEYVEKPKKEKKVETLPQEEPRVRPPDPPTTMRLLHRPMLSHYQHGLGQAQQFRLAMEMSKRQHEQKVAKQKEKQLKQRQKMQKQQKESEQRQKKDFQKKMKQARLSKLKKSGTKELETKKEMQVHEKNKEMEKVEKQLAKKKQAQEKRKQQSKKRAEAFMKKLKQ
jgi:hypothetical protein